MYLSIDNLYMRLIIFSKINNYPAYPQQAFSHQVYKLPKPTKVYTSNC